VRHVVSFYGLDVRRLPREDPRWEARYRELFDEVALVLCEGPAMADAIAALGCDRARIRIHRLGVDLGRLPPFRSRTAAPGRLRVLMAGSFREKKGFPDALEALGQLVRDGLDVSGTLIGDAGPRDTAERDRILASLRRAGLEDRIRLTGFQPHTRLLAEADAHDVFLSPSVTAADGDCEGGAPVSIIEMAAIGLPVLSTTHCDIPTVLGEPNRALLVPERDPEALARACHALLERDWDVIARANRELVETELDARQQGERLAHAYFPGDPH
jgi:colanic acid/amylovoran biosynthesis glycosyltransferase